MWACKSLRRAAELESAESASEEVGTMSEDGWVTTCPVCKWRSLVFTREAAEAAGSAHERFRHHQGVTVNPASRVGPRASWSAAGDLLRQRA